MSISFEKAFHIAKEVFEEFEITSCTELDDYWVFFAFPKADEIQFIPPLCVFKSGKDIKWWKKNMEFNNCFECEKWLKENGKEVSLANLK